MRLILKFCKSEKKRVKSNLCKVVSFHAILFQDFILWPLLFHLLECYVLESGNYHYCTMFLLWTNKIKTSIFNDIGKSTAKEWGNACRFFCIYFRRWCSKNLSFHEWDSVFLLMQKEFPSRFWILTSSGAREFPKPENCLWETKDEPPMKEWNPYPFFPWTSHSSHSGPLSNYH